MSRFQMLSLAVLTATVYNQEQDGETYDDPIFGGAPEEMKAAIQAQLQEERAVAMKDAAREAIEIAKLRHAAIREGRAEMRKYSEMRKAKKAQMDRIDRAFQYALATQNYFPIALQLGINPDWRKAGLTFKEFESLKEVPEDWSPAPVEAPTTEG